MPLNLEEYENGTMDDIESVSTENSTTESNTDLDRNEELEEVDDFEIHEPARSNTPESLPELIVDTSMEGKDTIHVMKLEETEPLETNATYSMIDIDDQSTLGGDDMSVDTQQSQSQVGEDSHEPIPFGALTKKELQKMNVQMLRTMVIREGLCTEPSKMKKLELIQMILDKQ